MMATARADCAGSLHESIHLYAVAVTLGYEEPALAVQLYGHWGPEVFLNVRGYIVRVVGVEEVYVKLEVGA